MRWGNRAARPLHAAALRVGRFPPSSDLRSAGYGFDPRWYEAQREFRFPDGGQVDHGGVSRTAAGARTLARARRNGRERRHGALRRFIGRTPAGQGEVGFTPGRHAICCNGRRVPMTGSGVSGEAVAGSASGMAAAVRHASDDTGPRATDLRHLRSVERPGARRLRLSSPIRAAAIRDLPGQFPTRRKPGLARFQDFGHTPGRSAPPSPGTHRGVPADAGFAAGLSRPEIPQVFQSVPEHPPLPAPAGEISDRGLSVTLAAWAQRGLALNPRLCYL